MGLSKPDVSHPYVHLVDISFGYFHIPTVSKNIWQDRLRQKSMALSLSYSQMLVWNKAKQIQQVDTLGRTDRVEAVMANTQPSQLVCVSMKFN
jgi:hypothetical protein